MGTYEFVFAAVLLTTPADIELPQNDALSEILYPHAVAMAINSQNLDFRDKNFYQQKNYFPELRYSVQVAATYPRIEEAERFLPFEICKHIRFDGKQKKFELSALYGETDATKFIRLQIQCNNCFRDNMLKRLAIDCFHEDLIRQAISENALLLQCWENMLSAASESNYIVSRREALHNLRLLIGDRNFYEGWMPPPIPWWHLPRS